MRKRLPALCVVLVLGLCVAEPATATFPGRNGEIVVSHLQGNGSGHTWSLLAFPPRGGPGTNHEVCELPGWLDCLSLTAPAYAPGGKRVAVIAETTPFGDQRTELLVLAPDGQLVSTQRLDNAYEDVRWAPDRSRLLATVFVPEPDPRYPHPPTAVRGVWVLGRDGSERGLLPDAIQPDWCVGGRIVLVRAGSLRVVEPTGRVRRRPDRPGLEPSCSPDGRRIAFSRDDHIWVMPTTGGRARRLTEGFEPVWSPDGRQIAFLRTRENPSGTGSTSYAQFIHRIGLRKRIVRRVSGDPFWREDVEDESQISELEWRPLPRRR